MSVESPGKSVPIINGLFTWPSDTPRLIGTRCTSCNTYYFPKKQGCNNPRCKEKKIEEVLLSTRGKLWTYSIMRYPPAAPFKTDLKPPFPVGAVDLPEGIRVVGLITDCEVSKLAIGMELELVIGPLYRNEAGQEVVTWKFKPASTP